jgi:hypothetical protein
MRFALPALLLLTLAACGPTPTVDPQKLTVLVGETEYVRVTTKWEYPSTGYHPGWFFTTDRRTIIEVRGSMSSGQPSRLMPVTGLRPGKAGALVIDTNDRELARVDVTVRCGDDPPVQPAEARLTARAGELVALRALTPLTDRTTFTWYLGRTGDTSFPILQPGPEIAFVSDDRGQHHVWVMATTPCSTSTAEFEIDVVPTKRRATR